MQASTVLEDSNPTLDRDAVLARRGWKSRITLWKALRKGEFPAPAYPGRDPRWLLSQILEHEKSLTKKATEATNRAKDAARKRAARRAQVLS
jgi:predicted DNA-binding transcriptional regulator AlpA